MPRSPDTYTLPPGTTPQAPNTVIGSAMFNAAMDDIATTFNTAWPVAIGVGAAGATGSWDAINAVGSDIASAGTINLTTATGPNLTITGATTITTVTLGSGNVRFARANAAFQLTASANLIINGSASSNYTTTAGDLLIFIGGSGSVTRVWAISGSVQAASNAEVIAGLISNKYVSPATAYFPTGFVYGLTLTTDTTDPTNDIVVAVGGARSDDDTANIVQTASLIKQTDVAWAVGTNAGSLDTGAVGNSRYAIWEIRRPDTGVVDTLTSTSFSSPTMPANYTQKVLLGEFTRAGGVNGTPLWYGPRRAVTGYAGITLGSPTASTSGTSIDFTGIPAWAKRVTLNITELSTSGTSEVIVRLGTSAGIETTNYRGASTFLAVGSMGTAIYTNGFGVYNSVLAADSRNGVFVFSLLGSNVWTGIGALGLTNNIEQVLTSGAKTLAGALDRVRITTVGGVDTFDTGTINISYE